MEHVEEEEEGLSRSLSHYLGTGATTRYGGEARLHLDTVPDWQSRHQHDTWNADDQTPVLGRTASLRALASRRDAPAPQEPRGGSSSRRKQPCLPKLIILAGPPGSGKSTFSKALMASRPLGTVIRVNKDDMRAKGEVDAVGSRALRSGHVTLIVDNCNGTPELRKQWLDSLPIRGGGGGGGKKKKAGLAGAVCVHLSTDLAECRHRVTHRKDHPTLSGAGGVRVAEEMW